MGAGKETIAKPGKEGGTACVSARVALATSSPSGAATTTSAASIPPFVPPHWCNHTRASCSAPPDHTQHP